MAAGALVPVVPPSPLITASRTASASLEPLTSEPCSVADLHQEPPEATAKLGVLLAVQRECLQPLGERVTHPTDEPGTLCGRWVST